MRLVESNIIASRRQCRINILIKYSMHDESYNNKTIYFQKLKEKKKDISQSYKINADF